MPSSSSFSLRKSTPSNDETVGQSSVHKLTTTSPTHFEHCCIFLSTQSGTFWGCVGLIELKYPELTKYPYHNQPIKHNTVHYINSKGPPVSAKPRRLDTDSLKIAKVEFQRMIQLNHMRPSKNE
ncbi:hypothetical protein AVEN_137956-1 [Araneus ventricosus]|uniref:Uncharacterized protein n=1 Tax=Araneus ventricosus TaxID=182803 RepID=A0A4Y2S514_ARAVE|nr:hypothetical protein AVEN_137956-1 [Araneus ventricosus]